MAAKSSATEDVRSTLRDLLDRGEEVVSVFLEELTGSTSLREELQKTVRRANLARQTVDKNLEAVLGALNLPTRRDYRRLMEEVHAVQGSITNLNMKVDRLLAAQMSDRAASAVPQRTPPTPPQADKRVAGKAKTVKRPTTKRALRRRNSA